MRQSLCVIASLVAATGSSAEAQMTPSQQAVWELARRPPAAERCVPSHLLRSVTRGWNIAP